VNGTYDPRIEGKRVEKCRSGDFPRTIQKGKPGAERAAGDPRTDHFPVEFGKDVVCGEAARASRPDHRIEIREPAQSIEFQSECTRLCATIEQLTQERGQLTTELSDLRSEDSRVVAYNSALRAEVVELQSHCQTFDEMKAKLEATLIALRRKEAEFLASERQIGELQAAQLASMKESKKLKALFQRSLDNEKNSQQRIETLQAELKLYSDRLPKAHDGHQENLLETVIRLEQRNQELEQRLTDGKGSAELEAKIAKLNAMLEKSNLLYTQAVSRSHEMTDQIPHKQLAFWRAVSLAIEPDAGREKKSNDGFVVNAYLKTTLIQFFGHDAARRGELVPLILELVGCSAEQIRAAQRQWHRSNQLIQKTTGLFGF
jgi:hypothetical protein